MATRRLRVKPTAILKARRAPAPLQTENGSNKEVEDPTISEPENIPIVVKDGKLLNDIAPIPAGVDNKATIFPITANQNVSAITSPNTSNNIPNEMKPPTPGSVPTPNPPPQTASDRKPFRRMMMPAVNLPNRRKNQTTSSIGKVLQSNMKPIQAASSPARSQEIASIRSPSPAKAEQKPSPNQLTMVKPEAMGVVATDDDFDAPNLTSLPSTEEFSPQVGATIDDDECFKSPPFMSPSMQYQRRPDPSSSPFVDSFGDDYAKSPSSMSSSKIRARIRPTPYFMVRRNSIQVGSHC